MSNELNKFVNSGAAHILIWMGGLCEFTKGIMTINYKKVYKVRFMCLSTVPTYLTTYVGICAYIQQYIKCICVYILLFYLYYFR